MIKRLTAGICAFALVFALSACNADKNNNDLTSQATTVKETRIHNYFKDVLPKFNFKNETAEEYNEGISYVLRVESSEKEVKKYLKKLKDAGFTESAVESENYYAARNADRFHIELTHIDGILTVYVRKM